MSGPLSFGALFLALVGLAAAHEEEAPACRPTEAIRAQPPADPNADPFGSGPWQVNDDRTPIEITSRRGDAVLLSRVDYDALEETAHLLRVPANRKTNVT